MKQNKKRKDSTGKVPCSRKSITLPIWIMDFVYYACERASLLACGSWCLFPQVYTYYYLYLLHILQINISKCWKWLGVPWAQRPKFHILRCISKAVMELVQCKLLIIIREKCIIGKQTRHKAGKAQPPHTYSKSQSSENSFHKLLIFATTK